jgi:Ca2+-binding RTX toxin-like protein
MAPTQKSPSFVRLIALAALGSAVASAGTAAHTKVGSDHGIANAGATSVITGTAGPDNLTGTPGNDTINGLGGADVMIGLAGDDTYIVDNFADKVLEKLGEGKDTVRASVGYALPANVEGLVLTGAGDVLGMGNSLNNRIAGNTGYNTLDGGPGNDTLTGGPGRDMFRFRSELNGSTNVDRLTDFDVADDTIALHHMAFPALTPATANVLPPPQFHVGASATTTSQRIVYNRATGALFYDGDGTGSMPAVRFAIVPKGLAVTYRNFLIFARFNL